MICLVSFFLQKMQEFDLDEVLDKEIKFGKYQLFIFALIAFPIALNGIFSNAFVFTAGNLNYRWVSLSIELIFLLYSIKIDAKFFNVISMMKIFSLNGSIFQRHSTMNHPKSAKYFSTHQVTTCRVWQSLSIVW